MPIEIIECKPCKKKFKNKKSMTNHRRWHKLPEYNEFQKNYRRNISKANLGEKNGMWKGDMVGYKAIHDWIKSRKPKPDYCECCEEKKPFDCANISGKYKRDLSDWEWLCRYCYMEKDGRLSNLRKTGRGQKCEMS